MVPFYFATHTIAAALPAALFGYAAYAFAFAKSRAPLLFGFAALASHRFARNRPASAPLP
jgi:hypothetical protein